MEVVVVEQTINTVNEKMWKNIEEKVKKKKKKKKENKRQKISIIIK